MDEQQRALNRRYETVAWGAFFIWWGVTGLFSFLPEGVSTIGLGLIFIGLNVARYANQISTSSFTIALGVLALAVGGFELARAILNLSFDLPFMAIVLIGLGIFVLAREFKLAR